MADLTATVQAQHPEWNIVRAIEHPDGGIIAVGADGGVFNLPDAQGRVSPFYGSYQSGRIENVWDPIHRNDPSRRFVDIQYNAASGGYTLISKEGERYNFFDPARQTSPDAIVGAPPPAATTTPPGVDANQESIRATLKVMGLEGLADKAWTYWKQLGTTASDEAVNLWIRQQPEFAERFPGMAYLEKQGQFWSPADYLTYEREIKQSMEKAGMPPGFWDDPTDIQKFIENDWSLDEVKESIGLAQNAVMTMPAEDRAFLAELGVTTGDLTAFWLDPDTAGNDLITRKITAGRAALGGAVERAGLDITGAEATNLFNLGISPEEAAQRAGAFAPGGQANPLLAETVEETADLGRDTAVAFLEGDTEAGIAAGAALDARKRARAARFEGGGGAASMGRGRSGLG